MTPLKRGRLSSTSTGFFAGALVLVGTGFVTGAVQNMGFGLLLLLVLLAIPGGLVVAIVNPRRLLYAALMGAAVSAIIVFAILAVVASRI